MNLQKCEKEKEIYFELYKRFTRIVNFLYDNKLVQAHQELQRISSEFLQMEKKTEELTRLVVMNIADVVSNVRSGAVIQAYYGSREISQSIQEKMKTDAK